MAKAIAANRAVDESEHENAVGHPLEPAEMSGGKQGAPVPAERQKQARTVTGEAGQSASAAEIGHAERRAIERKGVLELLPEIRRTDEPEQVVGLALAAFDHAAEHARHMAGRIDDRTIRHDRREVERPRPPKDEPRQRREHGGEPKEPVKSRFHWRLPFTSILQK